MKIRKFGRQSRPIERDLTGHQRQILATIISDERHNAWAIEMLGSSQRRSALAWAACLFGARGDPGTRGSAGLKKEFELAGTVGGHHDW